MNPCVCNDDLTIEEFVTFFPEFQGMEMQKFVGAFMRSSAYVDPTCCPGGWSCLQHKVAVLLATAHAFMKTPYASALLKANGAEATTEAAMGSIIMATEGSVSIMRKTITPQNATQSDLLQSPYGEILLSLMEGIQPPKTTISPAPYYPTGYNVRYPDGFEPSCDCE